jgi:hypothetical protein
MTPWSKDLLEKLTVPQLFKKLPAFNLNPFVCYSIHKNLTPDPILSQINPFHISPAHFLKI